MRKTRGKCLFVANCMFFPLNKWRGVTITLRTGGQGQSTPIYTQQCKSFLLGATLQLAMLKFWILHDSTKLVLVLVPVLVSATQLGRKSVQLESAAKPLFSSVPVFECVFSVLVNAILCM